MIMNTKTIRQTIVFRSTPHEVYELLMDSDKHTVLVHEKLKKNPNERQVIHKYFIR